MLRDQAAGPFISLAVTSDRRWALRWRDPPTGESVQVGGGTIPSFDTNAGGKNHLRIVAIEERGWLFVNGEFVSSLDLSGVTGAGDVAILTGAIRGNEIAGAVTQFENFRGNRLSKRYGPADGKLEREPGLIVATHDSGTCRRGTLWWKPSSLTPKAATGTMDS